MTMLPVMDYMTDRRTRVLDRLDPSSARRPFGIPLEHTSSSQVEAMVRIYDLCTSRTSIGLLIFRLGLSTEIVILTQESGWTPDGTFTDSKQGHTSVSLAVVYVNA